MNAQASKIITFYSYKGGVGRSMALANVAYLLATKYHKKVLVVDWDLEAPGLHRFFNIGEERIKKGLIDLLYDYKNLLSQDISSLGEEQLKIDKYLDNQLKMDDYFIKPSEGIIYKDSILLLPSGRHDGSYAKRVNEFNWDKFYTDWYGFGFIEYLKERLKKKADIILIDSRTGVTDTGGICTLQLPDVVVLLFALNEQNISGMEMIAESILKKSSRVKDKQSPPKLILIPSRVERYLEQKRKDKWEKKAAKRLNKFMPIEGETEALTYLKKKNIPYMGYFNFGEELAVIEQPYEELATSLNNLTGSILKAADFLEEEISTTYEPLDSYQYKINGFIIKFTKSLIEEMTHALEPIKIVLANFCIAYILHFMIDFLGTSRIAETGIPLKLIRYIAIVSVVLMFLTFTIKDFIDMKKRRRNGDK